MTERIQIVNLEYLGNIYNYINNIRMKNTHPRFGYCMDMYIYEGNINDIIKIYKNVIIKKKIYTARNKDFFEYYLPKEHWLSVLQTLSDKVYNDDYFTEEQKDDIECHIRDYFIIHKEEYIT